MIFYLALTTAFLHCYHKYLTLHQTHDFCGLMMICKKCCRTIIQNTYIYQFASFVEASMNFTISLITVNQQTIFGMISALLYVQHLGQTMESPLSQSMIFNFIKYNIKLEDRLNITTRIKKLQALTQYFAVKKLLLFISKCLRGVQA